MPVSPSQNRNNPNGNKPLVREMESAESVQCVGFTCNALPGSNRFGVEVPALPLFDHVDSRQEFQSLPAAHEFVCGDLFSPQGSCRVSGHMGIRIGRSR
jgi:hypothetical protein